MADTYNILDEKEMSETISIVECRNLRQTVNMLTAAPMITKKEYVRLMVVIDGILSRMEKEDVQNANPANQKKWFDMILSGEKKER